MAPMANGSKAMPEVVVETTGTTRAEARVADTALESRAAKPAVLEEQMARPEASKGVVGHAVRPWSPWRCLHLRRTRWKKSSGRNYDLKLFESSASKATKWWSLRMRTPPGSLGDWSPPLAE